MFPYWSRATEEHVAALLAGEQCQANEHETAVQRLAEAQATGGVTPPRDGNEIVVCRRPRERTWDSPNTGPGPERDCR
jgi:hypothetical protein